MKIESATAQPHDRTWLGIAVLALLLAGSIFSLQRADRSKPADWNESQLTYIPSGNFLKPMLLDQDAAAADLLWIRGMIYFADAYLEGKSYKWLGHILDVITTLNPHFYHAYEFGGTVLTKQKSELPLTLRVLNRGMAEYPQDWRLRVYAALAQLGLDSDYVKAAEYLKPVILEKDVPDHIRTLSATFLSKGGGNRMALAFLVNSYVQSDNTINREIFIDKILKLYPASDSVPEQARREMVIRVLHEASIDPAIEMVALGVLHEYLSGKISPQTARLLDMLR